LSDIRITPSATGKRLLIFTPFNADYVVDIKEIGGRWDTAKRAWSVDARDEERVRDLVRAYFGTDGSPEDTVVLVTVRIPLRRYELPYHSGAKAQFAGRIIAERSSRDAPVKLSDGVVLVAGELPRSGGSMKYPEIDAGTDVLVEVRDLPRSVLELYDGGYEIVSESSPAGVPEAEQLRARRSELLLQVQELDGQLRRLDPEGEAQREEATTKELTASITARLGREFAQEKDAAIRELVLAQAARDAERAAEAQRLREEERRVAEELKHLPIGCRCGSHTCPPVGYSVAQYAEMKGKKPQTVMAWCRNGKVPAVQHNGRWYITTQ
jgi:hypothetical protein